jgi:mono/diheme cytochrome c family protein
MRTHRLLVFAVAAVCVLALCGTVVSARGPRKGAAVPAAAEEGPDFLREVRPILAVSCVRCHSAALPQGQLRLDSREGLRDGGASGAVFVAGRPEDSLLVTRLLHDDPAKRMPWMTEPLPVAEIDILRRWVAAGAPWPEGVTVVMATAAPAPVVRPVSTPRDASSLSFNRDVRPILAGNCYACHGPDRNNRQMGLRLDREDVAKSRLPSGSVAIVAGKPDDSALVRRILDPDENRRMPHVSSGKPRLSPAEVATLRRWIEEGALWEPHWAYLPPRRPMPPIVKQATWTRGAVDAFVLQAIEAQALRPSTEAGRGELLRRLSFDLTGLPPTLEEALAFARDRGEGAYERQVDRLLASPRFGERMAVFWLDLVRYADSVGYHSDNARPMWRYRDWVVGAFNRNLPFDRFTAEQLAGDLLPDAGFEQKVASGYNRLLQTTEEGGAQPKEYRAIYLADHVRNASTVWLGATLGCAQCHDHKFDPFLARDFASFSAFFADVKEPPVGRRQPDYLPDAEQKRQLDEAKAEVNQLKKTLETETPNRAEGRARWEETLLTRPVFEWKVLEPVEAETALGTRALIQGNDFSIIATTAAGPKPPRDIYTVRFKTDLQGITAFRLEALTFDELPRGGPGRHDDGGFVVSEIEVRDADGRAVGLRNASASTPFETGARATPAAAVDGDSNDGGWTLHAADGESHRLVVEAAEPVGTGAETTLTLVLHQNAGGSRTLGRFRLSATTATGEVGTAPGPDVTAEHQKTAGMPAAERTEKEQESLTALYRRSAPELAAERAALRAAELRLADLRREAPSSYITVAQEPEVVRLLPRGNWLDESGEVVTPGVPHFLPPLDPGDRRATRLDLARWLTARENPLTARVFVNRLWKLYFAQGLSRTLEDLGSQGEWPTHPELLDWLAVEFMESGWDVKHVVRTLVTSATYRQSSKGPAELLQKDPWNRLYARQSRFRLDAEMVRDNALAVSGLLSMKIGGPSVYPYQPLGYWAYLNFPPREWDDSVGQDQYRRGLYTWWQRTFPQPSLLAFDAPSREECVGERVRSNVPQQALALLNDPTYVEAARVFAERILRKGGTSFASRLRFAYARALQRAPNEDESRVLRALLEKARREFAADPRAAKHLVAVGQHVSKPDLAPAELAAWTQVARAILNLPELITRS